MTNDVNKVMVYLHIGLHKTATTYLQGNIFPRLKGVKFYNKRLVPVKLYEGKSKILISNEGMSGCPYLIDGVNYFDQFSTSLNYLMELFKKSKIIICFREPSSFIESCYKQYLHEGGTLEWEDFFSVNGGAKLEPDIFYFSKYVEMLGNIVPEGKLFIYDFDTFKKNNKVVIDEMATFITGSPFLKEIKKTRKSNSSVPLSLEPLLLKCNRIMGDKLNIKIFGKVFSQRTILQTYIPRLFQFDKKRDLSQIKKYYEMDYTKTKKMISDLNPALYSKLAKK